ncbi:unnamed protein product [Cuscuta epithymum]|uniref:Uncharacterized protein n=1 Tax=Cuscuta epithymum TaxID=186058 RepID=A0AAV0GKC1_9ASTE|nr:unnamed protein product [Cuscuta epithymum]
MSSTDPQSSVAPEVSTTMSAPVSTAAATGEPAFIEPIPSAAESFSSQSQFFEPVISQVAPLRSSPSFSVSDGVAWVPPVFNWSPTRPTIFNPPGSSFEDRPAATPFFSSARVPSVEPSGSSFVGPTFAGAPGTSICHLEPGLLNSLDGPVEELKSQTH